MRAQPIVANLHYITGNLTNAKGSLGEWVIPTNINSELETNLVLLKELLVSADRTIDGTETNLALTLSNLNLTLLNLADITSNLHTQVDQNTNLVSGLNSAILQADTLMQGLKRHWLLRSAFKEKPTNAPASSSKPAGNSSPYTGRKP